MIGSQAWRLSVIPCTSTQRRAVDPDSARSIARELCAGVPVPDALWQLTQSPCPSSCAAAYAVNIAIVTGRSTRRDDGAMTTEEPLAGGFGNLGEVVRVGDTVRRPPRPSTLAVRALLLHLEAAGFDGAPRYLGTDEQGREVLTFVDGRRPAAAVSRLVDERRAAGVVRALSCAGSMTPSESFDAAASRAGSSTGPTRPAGVGSATTTASPRTSCSATAASSR